MNQLNARLAELQQGQLEQHQPGQLQQQLRQPPTDCVAPVKEETRPKVEPKAEPEEYVEC